MSDRDHSCIAMNSAGFQINFKEDAMKRAIAFFVSLILFCMPLLASDIMMKQQIHSDAVQIMGQSEPEKNFTQTVWISGDNVAMLSEEASVLYLADKNQYITINHNDKTYTIVSQEPLFGDDEQGEMQQMMQAMMGSATLTVTPAGQKQKVGQWNCEKYIQNIEIMGIKTVTEIWATEEIQIPKNMMQKIMAAPMMANPAMKSMMDKMNKEMGKIKGFPVKSLSETNMMGSIQKSSSELIEFTTNKKAPKNVFEIPAGYKQQKNPMQGF